MQEIKNRLADLASQSYVKNIFTFSDFLSEAQIGEVEMVKFDVPKVAFGGCDFATRKMLRFGGDCYGSGDFPLEILQISPKSAKFASEISHRDVLGSVMNLGIAREKVGDIFCENSVAFVVLERVIARHVFENLERVGRNSVKVETAFEIPPSFQPKTESMKISISSPRLDSVICKIFNLSREGVLELFSTQKVSVDSKIIENNSKNLSGGEVVSVRGFGKFKFVGELGISRKGKKWAVVEKFV
ncbi:MAG: YlmH/Sll1252 family protein [Bacillota bacterium]